MVVCQSEGVVLGPPCPQLQAAYLFHEGPLSKYDPLFFLPPPGRG